MISNLPLLDNIQIAAPCKAAWEHMEGDEQVRYCCECQKNVYNLSAMSRKEAEELIRKHEGRLCVRLYQRADGTVLTDNCPVGLRAIRRLFVKQVAMGASLMTVLFNVGMKAHPEHTMGDIGGREVSVEAGVERHLTKLDDDKVRPIPAVWRDPFVVPESHAEARAGWTMGTPMDSTPRNAEATELEK